MTVSGVPELVEFPVAGADWSMSIPRQNVEMMIEEWGGGSWRPTGGLPAAFPCSDGLLFAVPFVHPEGMSGYAVGYYKMGVGEIEKNPGVMVHWWKGTRKSSKSMEEEIVELGKLGGAVRAS